ncbi:MAG: transposase [Bacteriovoracaceae bacterium]
MKQLKLNLTKGKRGGKREGSGRKRIHSPGVAHRARQKVTTRTPLHINFKYKTQIRNKDNLRLLKKAILNSRRHGLRIMHFSLQSNHVHLIVEAGNNELLTKGMRSLTVTMARGLKKGKVQLERFHLHVLRAPREIKNAIEYVCFNKQKHEKARYSVMDDYGSFPGTRMVQDFVKKNRMTITLSIKEFWTGDSPRGFLLQKLFFKN